MKIALKYGAIIAAGIAIWVVADHFLLHITGPGSKAGFLTPLFFNLLQLVMVFLGIRAKRSEQNGVLPLQQGLATGMSISLVYAVLSCTFFLVLYLIVGSKLLENEPGGPGTSQPEKYVLLVAFAGMFFGALVAGLIYSLAISFVMRKK